jgi:hypothetical protein
MKYKIPGPYSKISTDGHLKTIFLASKVFIIKSKQQLG